MAGILLKWNLAERMLLILQLEDIILELRMRTEK